MTLQECIDAVKRSISAAKHDAALDILERYAAGAPRESLNEKILLLRQRLAALNDQYLISATITEDEYSAEINQLSMGIIELLKSLQVSEKLPQQGGSLLHNIPPKMRKDKRMKVVVRIAYTDEVALTGLDKATVTLSKLPRMTSLMSVELVDPFDGFEVKGVSDENQATFHESYTEWQYYVRPLQAGEAILVVKVSAIEDVNGHQVPHNVVVEQPVIITVEAVSEEQPWVNTGRVELQQVAPGAPTKDDSPKAPAPSAVVQPSRGGGASKPTIEKEEAATRAQPRKKSLPWGRIAGIAAAILCVVLLLPTLSKDKPEPIISDIAKEDSLGLAPEVIERTEIVEQGPKPPPTPVDTASRNAGDTPEEDVLVPKAPPTEGKPTSKGPSEPDTSKPNVPLKSPGGFANPYDTGGGNTKRDTIKNE